MRLDIAEPHISLKAGTDQPGTQRQCLGGEQEESAPKASRESYFGAATVMVQPHACPTRLPATAPLKNNNKQLKKKLSQLQHGRHPSVVFRCKRQVKKGRKGGGGGETQTKQESKKKEGWKGRGRWPAASIRSNKSYAP